MKKTSLLVEKLINKNYRICFSESCTGGMLCSSVVDVPSASQVLDMSFVTYANSAKINLLGVDGKTIEKYGVVSETVAGQMAEGAAKVSGAEVAVGVSGIAGPSGGSAEKPIGTVCFGFYINGKVVTKTCHFGDIGRNNVRKSACDTVIDTLLDMI